jgi:hypothetical protein
VQNDAEVESTMISWATSVPQSHPAHYCAERRNLIDHQGPKSSNLTSMEWLSFSQTQVIQEAVAGKAFWRDDQRRVMTWTLTATSKGNH